MARSQLDPITQLDALASAARKQFAFTAKTQASAQAWQKRARRALSKTLGFLDQERVNLAPETIERVDRGAYVREKVLLRTSATSVMPTYVLIPKREADSTGAVEPSPQPSPRSTGERE